MRPEGDFDKFGTNVIAGKLARKSAAKPKKADKDAAKPSETQPEGDAEKKT